MSGNAEPARRWHAITGVVPLGVFLLLHIGLNAQALRGHAPFDRAVALADALPLARALEVLLVLLPLAFHAALGVLFLVRPSTAEPSPYPVSWRALNRGAAWVALAFIAYHVATVRYGRVAHGVGPAALHTFLVAHLSNSVVLGAAGASEPGDLSGVLFPWTAMIYLIGLAATVVHFSAGAWGYLVRFRHVTTPRATRRAAYASGALGLVLFGLASTTIVSFASGSPLFLAAPPSSPCPTR